MPLLEEQFFEEFEFDEPEPALEVVLEGNPSSEFSIEEEPGSGRVQADLQRP